MLTFLVLLLLGLLIPVLAFGQTFNPLDLFSGAPQDVSVPDLEGLTQARALVELTDAELELDSAYAYSTTVVRGQVITQVPQPGEIVEEGTLVTVTVSQGAARIEMPNLVDISEATAVAELEELGLLPQVVRRADEDVAVGSVVSHEPTAGSIVSGGSLVEIVISTGPPDREVPVVSGYTVPAALFELGRARFTMGAISYQPEPLTPFGTVIATTPPAESMAPVDTPVGLIVSCGPADGRMPSLIGFTEADAGELVVASCLVASVGYESVGGDSTFAGLVSDQDPGPGEPVTAGQPVQITVAQAG